MSDGNGEQPKPKKRVRRGRRLRRKPKNPKPPEKVTLEPSEVAEQSGWKLVAGDLIGVGPPPPSSIGEAGMVLLAADQGWAANTREGYTYVMETLIQIAEHAGKNLGLRLRASQGIERMLDKQYERSKDKFTALVKMREMGEVLPGREAAKETLAIEQSGVDKDEFYLRMIDKANTPEKLEIIKELAREDGYDDIDEPD